MRTHTWIAALGALVAFQSGCGMAAAEARPTRSAPSARPRGDVALAGGMVAPVVEESDQRVAAAYPEAPQGAPAPPAPPPPPPPAPETKPSGADKKAEVATAPGARDASMIVYTATLTMAVYQVQPNLTAVERIAKEKGGFLAIRGDNRITVRVPRERFEDALGAIEKVGDVLHRDVTAEDVTDQYTDLEIRIKNSRAMQTRLKQLLEKAAVKEALEIEKELARVTEELELMEGKLKLLKDKIAYSTITVVFEGRGAALQGAQKVRLPFPWLGQLGLVNLLRLEEEKP
jgi:hypothetical protein